MQFENNEAERARLILDKARASDSSSTQRVWMKSAIVERELKNAEAERKILEEGIAKFPYFDKLWLMLGQLEERQTRPDAARQVGHLLAKRAVGCQCFWDCPLEETSRICVAAHCTCCAEA